MQLKESDSLHRYDPTIHSVNFKNLLGRNKTFLSIRDGAMVDILTGLVFVFIICTTPLLLFTIYEWISFIIIYNDYNYDYYEG